MRRVAIVVLMITLGLGTSAVAASCRGNAQALGTSRTIAINPQELGRIGKMQYSQYPQLPLNDHEVVLTFDDGPLPPYTDQVLKALAAQCVKATFFSVGRQATQFPDTLRRVFNEGHSVGTHSQNHPLTFDQMPFESAQREIDDGIASVSTALGNPRAVAPFFRIPGLLRIADVEEYLNSKGIVVWSVDADADDWYKTATPESVISKAMTRLNQRGRGILLLHDVQPVTAMALPGLLRELKTNGYRVVHVVPQNKHQPPRVAAAGTDAQGWPRTLDDSTSDIRRKKPQHQKRRVIYRDRRYYEWQSAPSTFDDWQYFRR